MVFVHVSLWAWTGGSRKTPQIPMLNCREDMIQSPCLQSHIYARNWAPKRWKFHGNSFNFPLKSPFSSGSSYLFEAVWICFQYFWILWIWRNCGRLTLKPEGDTTFFLAVVAGWWGECITLHNIAWHPRPFKLGRMITKIRFRVGHETIDACSAGLEFVFCFKYDEIHIPTLCGRKDP